MGKLEIYIGVHHRGAGLDTGNLLKRELEDVGSSPNSEKPSNLVCT